MLFNEFIREPVGNNLTNNPLDVRTIKSAFTSLGLFDENEPNGFVTRPLDNTIKAFQRDDGLKVDGLIYPDGETEKELQKQPVLKTLPQEDHYHPVHNPDGPMPLEPQKLIMLEEDPSIKAKNLNANSEESVSENDSETSSEDAQPENSGDESATEDVESSEDSNSEETPEPPIIKRDEIIRQLVEQENAEEQQALENLQEKQTEQIAQAPIAGFGQPAQNVDATGRTIREDVPPVPEKKPSSFSDNTKDSIFEKFRENLAPREGGVADRHIHADPGGLTNQGMSQAFLDELNARSPELGLPKKPTDLTDEQINEIFKTEFFDRPQIDKLHEVAGADKTNSKLVEHVFDAHVLTSPQTVGRWLQESIDETIGTDLKGNKNGQKQYDGILGSKTRKALEKAVDAGKTKEINERFSEKRIDFLRNRPNYQYNKNGWERRVRDLKD